MRIRNVYSDDVRVPDLDDLVIKAGEVVDVPDAIGWGLCRGGAHAGGSGWVAWDGDVNRHALDIDPRKPYPEARFQPADEKSMKRFSDLEWKERRRGVGAATAVEDGARGLYVVRCPLCRRWLVRFKHDGLIVAINNLATIAAAPPYEPDHIRHGYTIGCGGKCPMRFAVIIPHDMPRAL